MHISRMHRLLTQCVSRRGFLRRGGGRGQDWLVSGVNSSETTAAPAVGTTTSTLPAQFFGVPTYLTVSGQLHAEMFASAMTYVLYRVLLLVLCICCRVRET